MMLYLYHPRHGVKIAMLEAEAEMDKANGWSETPFDSPAPTVDQVVDEIVAQRGRGRPRKGE
jgi:hypothetical protein